MKHILITSTLFISMLMYSYTAVAQEESTKRPDPEHPVGENLEVPLDWEVRLDHSKDDVIIGADKESSDIYFVTMTPGWHITTGPAAIFYHPESTAEKAFQASATIHLFDPGKRNEGFGIFVGGKNLDNEEQSYLYFLIRNSGEFLIKRREGDDTHVVQNWTEHASIATFNEDTESSVENTLAITVGEEEVIFHINGEQVTTVAQTDIQTDGIVGLRVNHSLNLHISDLKVD